jgi:hypothetical protein
MSILEIISLSIINGLYYLLHNLYWLGIFNSAFLLSLNAKEEAKKTKIIYAVIGILSFIPIAAYFLIPYLPSYADTPVMRLTYYADLWVGCVAGSWLLTVIWLRVGVQKAELLRKVLTRTSSLERNKKTDIRNIDAFLPSDKQRFDPLSYINYKKGYFIGLSEENAPIYIKQGDWETAHLLLSGRTRSGKGVGAQIIGAQSIQQKELFVVLDPKLDNYMPHIYRKICIEADQPYHFLDLRQSAYPQINLFEGCSEEVIENMLIGAFSLTEKGTDADYYRIGDRKAARQTAKYMAQHPGITPKEVLAVFANEWKDMAAGFAAALEEMAELPAVNRRSGGISIDNLERTGGCLYVVGDMMNTRIIRMQRMILIRLMMLAKNRDQLEKQRIIRVFADEFRVHISRPFIVSLGASAGWRLLSILAFQSFEDLRDCPADLDADMVKGAVIENCALQLSYRIKDSITAELLASATGTILVDTETRKIDKNVLLTETVGERRISQSERYLVDVNMITSLPVPDQEKETIGCGVLVGAGKLAQFCFTSPIQIDRSKAAITPSTLAPAPEEMVKSVSDKLADLEDIGESLLHEVDLPILG